MRVIIDRFENNFAVVELPDKSFADMPISLVPSGAKEGDVISIEIDRGETAKREKHIKEMLDKIFEQR